MNIKKENSKERKHTRKNKKNKKQAEVRKEKHNKCFAIHVINYQLSQKLINLN